MNDKMVTAVLVDDESASRSVLRTLLSKFCGNVHILCECGELDEAYEMLTSLNPQLVFLDVRMPGGDTFKLLSRFEHIDFQIIFVTSYDEYAISAIKYSALDYLLKPIEVDELQKAVTKATRFIAEKRNTSYEMVHFVQNSEQPEQHKTIVVHDKGKVNFVRIHDIMYIRSEANYAIIFMENGSKLIAAKPLKYFDELLSDTQVFLRVHKSYLVNSQFISGYTKKEPFFLVLKSGVEIEISRRKKQEVNLRLKGGE